MNHDHFHPQKTNMTGSDSTGQATFPRILSLATLATHNRLWSAGGTMLSNMFPAG
jgi:hypothetical protein